MKYTVVEIKNLNVWVKHTLNKTEEKLVNRNIVENYPECRPPKKPPRRQKMSKIRHMEHSVRRYNIHLI